jgi:hypothetical protein
MALFTTELEAVYGHSCGVLSFDKSAVLSCEKPADSVLWSSLTDPEMFTCLEHGERAVKSQLLPLTLASWTLRQGSNRVGEMYGDND